MTAVLTLEDALAVVIAYERTGMSMPPALIHAAEQRVRARAEMVQIRFAAAEIDREKAFTQPPDEPAIAAATKAAVEAVRWLDEQFNPEEHVRQAIPVFLASLAEHGAATVPVEPTEAMIDAAMMDIAPNLLSMRIAGQLASAWRKMIAASPEAFKGTKP